MDCEDIQGVLISPYQGKKLNIIIIVHNSSTSSWSLYKPGMEEGRDHILAYI